MPLNKGVTKKYFPIQTKTACKSKWAWSTIWFYDGTTASCHRCDRHPIDLNNFDSFHNTPPKIEQREAMLRGEWPKSGGCHYCQKIEEAGGYSDRQFQLQIPNQTPPEVEKDPTVTTCTPTILEIFLSNTCNLSCTYCRPANSSKIETEMKKFGEFRVGTVHRRNAYDAAPKINQEEIKSKFWNWMARNSNALRRFHILGGEPMFMPDFQDCLTHWDKYPNPNVEINVISNLMVDEKRFKDYIDYIKHLYNNKKIKRFDLTASIDCWGPEQEYVRMGLDLNVFENNMNYLLSQSEEWLRINVNQTICALTIKTMPELIKKINEWKDQRTEFGHYFQKLVEPEIMAVTNFDFSTFEKDFEKVMSLMRNKTWDEQHAYKMMQGIIAQIKDESKEQPDQIEKLKDYLTEIDERRGSNWKSIFGWLK